jgi:hypothetical protein
MLEEIPWEKDPPEVLNYFGKVVDMSNFTGSAM